MSKPHFLCMLAWLGFMHNFAFASSEVPIKSLYPFKIKVQAGSISQEQDISVLAKVEQTGEADDWNTYIDFQPANQFNANLLFKVPAEFLSSDHLNLTVNYRGWDKARQRWYFSILNKATQKWVYLGDNEVASDWVWTMLSYPIPGRLSDYVDAQNRISIRYKSDSNKENSFLDYMAINILATPTPAPQPTPVPSPSPSPNTKVYGVTIDSISNLSDITESLRRLAKKPTTRIVFDEYVESSYYLEATRQIKQVSYVMGEILDSYYVKQYTLADYQKRVTEYLNTLGEQVDIWEVGNEVNGEWLGTTSDVVAKISNAYDQVKAKGKVSELTLYYNEECWAKPEHEMFRWTQANIPQRMKDGLDYVLVSYYEDDCNGLQPDWSLVMNKLGQIFPNSKIGLGEVGTTKQESKASYIRRYYSMSIAHPRYVGGYFWWYYKQDMVPYTQPLWSVLNEVIANH